MGNGGQGHLVDLTINEHVREECDEKRLQGRGQSRSSIGDRDEAARRRRRRGRRGRGARVAESRIAKEAAACAFERGKKKEGEWKHESTFGRRVQVAQHVCRETEGGEGLQTRLVTGRGGGGGK